MSKFQSKASTEIGMGQVSPMDASEHQHIRGIIVTPNLHLSK